MSEEELLKANVDAVKKALSRPDRGFYIDHTDDYGRELFLYISNDLTKILWGKFEDGTIIPPAFFCPEFTQEVLDAAAVKRPQHTWVDDAIDALKERA